MSRPLIALVTMALALAVVGCNRAGRMVGVGEPPPMRFDDWKHERKTLRDFDVDAYECRRDNPSARTQVAREMRERCMLSKGWARR